MSAWSPDEQSLRQEPYRVLLKRGEFVDSSRDGRAVPFKLYHPDAPDLRDLPVVVWSHGFGGNHDGASFISRFLAGQGYVLVHITHHGTDSSLWEGKEGHPWDILRKVKVPRSATMNRMLDVPFVLDQLPLWMEQNPEVGALMDLTRLGMSGHSFGAMTTQVMAGMRFPDQDGALISMPEKRFKAGILYSPVPIAHLTDAAPQEIYGSIDLPLFHMTGTLDDSPIEHYGYEHRLIVRDHAGHPEQYLHVLEGGDHMIYNGTRGKLANNPMREVHEREIMHGAFAFWQAYLKDDERAGAWLEERYAGKNG